MLRADPHLAPMLRAARPMARQVVRGALDFDDAMIALLCWAADADVRSDPSGASAYLAWTLQHWIAAFRQDQARSTRRIVRVLAPLIADGARSDTLLGAAQAANAEAGAPLLEHEVLAVVHQEVAMALRRGWRARAAA